MRRWDDTGWSVMINPITAGYQHCDDSVVEVTNHNLDYEYAYDLY